MGFAAQVLTLLRGVYLHLLFLPALLSAPLCMGLGVGREAWLLLMRWTLERAGPVRSLCCAQAWRQCAGLSERALA